MLLIAASFAMPLNAQDYTSAKDFVNTFEINVHKDGAESMEKCQAVRLNKNWFITAAHCVTPICDSSCAIQARLLIKDGYEMDIEVNHSSSRPAVFKHERAAVNKNEAAYDIALINFNPEYSHYLYKSLDEHMLLPKSVFNDKVKFTNAEYAKAVEGNSFPEILELKAKTPKTLNRSISAISIWDENRSVLTSTGIVIFSPKQHYIYTPNFGIRQGLSGSGLMTNKGELVGIVSSNAEVVRSCGSDTQTQNLRFSFMAAFDEYALSFIRRTVGNINYSVADDEQALSEVPEQYKQMADEIDNTVN